MPFLPIFNSLWERITSPFSFHGATTTPPPPSAPTNTPIPPLEGKYIECDTANDVFSSVDCSRLSNLSAVSMPGAYHPGLPALSTPPIGYPGFGFCFSSISTSPSPLFGCEEVEFDDSGFAGYPTSEGSPARASPLPSPYGRDEPAEPAITSRNSPTSLLPGGSGSASFTPSTNYNLPTPRSSNRTRPAGSATPGRYPTSPSPGCPEFGYFSPSTGPSYSSPTASSLPFSPPSSSPSPLLSPSPSGSFAGPAVSADLPCTQNNNSLQSSSKGGCKLDTEGVEMPEALSGNPALSEPIQGRAPEKSTRMLNRPYTFMKTSAFKPSFSDIALMEDPLDSGLSNGIVREKEHVSYAKKRALELEADIEVCPARSAMRTKPSRIPARKKARLAAKSSDSKATANTAAAPRGNTGTPPKIPPRTYRARRAAQAKSPTPPPSPSPPDPITPAKLQTLGCSCRRKRVQDGDVATAPTHKKLKTHCASPHKISKRKPRQAANSGRPRHTRASLGPSNGQPASCLPRPVKPRSLSASTELAGGYHPAPIRGTPLAKGAPATPLAKATSPRKRTNESTIVKSAATKRPRKGYFQEGMVLEYDSGDDEETVDEGLDAMEVRPATPLTIYPLPLPASPRANPRSSILGKRTSTDAQGFDARDTGNKKGRKECLQEGMILNHEPEEPITNGNVQNCSRRRVADYWILAPEQTLCAMEEEIQ